MGQRIGPTVGRCPPPPTIPNNKPLRITLQKVEGKNYLINFLHYPCPHKNGWKVNFKNLKLKRKGGKEDSSKEAGLVCQESSGGRRETSSIGLD